MSIQSEIVTALAGVVSGRVYPQAAPQDAVKPFVIYRQIGATPVMTVHGSNLTRTQFVFECWAATSLAALTTAASVRSALQINSLKWSRDPNPENGYSPESDEFVEPVTYGFWHT